mmetsp:Transcript_16471/g.39190  ORF Transcript_16471/g.39190 Transcript_16471/m.39190 type:complete len:129 (+) Transcript_16471:919-1305(+)
MSPYPRLVECLPPGEKVVEAALGDAHTMLLTDQGKVYTCGFGGTGALGHGDTSDKFYATHTVGLPHIVSVTSGMSVSICFTSEGQAFIWGEQNGVITSAPTPFQLPENTCQIRSVAGGWEHVVAVCHR